TNRMEYASDFTEEAYGEKTPPPVCLKTIDLKKDYSTQTSNHVAALYNVFLMKQDAKSVMNTFRKVANEAMQNCQLQYEENCHREKVKTIGKIKTLEYNELLKVATEKKNNKEVEEKKQRINNNSNLNELKMSQYI